MAVRHVQVFRLGVATQFASLSDREKRFAHHMARAAWLGARIILRQVSPESPAIFDFILELHRQCSGDWMSLVGPGVSEEDIQKFLTYAAAFLSNIGNYYGSGDQKFVPDLDRGKLEKLAGRSSTLSALYDQIAEPMFSRPPFGLGYQSSNSQSTYYEGTATSETDAALVSKVLEQNSIFPENTRLRKLNNGRDFEVLVASVDLRQPVLLPLPEGNSSVKLVFGDHAVDLQRICLELTEASCYAANQLQRDFLRAYIESFQSGSLDTYRTSQQLWVRDRAPRVENIFGFVEPYRDPHGVRAEFEGLVAIADDEETKLLTRLVEESARFIAKLPWAAPHDDGKGPFEKSLFEAPDFSSIHSLAYCSSIIFPGINLPNYNDIRQEHGFKNVIIANRMAAESQAQQYPFIDASEADTFQKHKFPAYYWWVVLHELLGHGTGRMMIEDGDGKFNFDANSPPINPLTGVPISSWYKPGQTWTGEFGDLATTVDECRAELVGAYLMDDCELLKLFGYTETSDIHPDDLTYNLYQQLGVDGLRGLANFNVESEKWGQAHSRAHFAMLKTLLLEGNGVIMIAHDKTNRRITVSVDRSKILSEGKPALGRMLLQLHMFRCTADSQGCRAYYENLTRVNSEHLEWRETVLDSKPPPLVFAQANTFLEGDTVVLKEYEPTVEGVIQSWAERDV